MEKKISDRFDSIQNLLKDIFELKIKDLKILLIEFLSLLMGHFASVFLFIGLFLISLLFLALGLSLYLNDLYGSQYLGFFTVAAIFIVTTLILIIVRNKKESPFFTNTFIRLFVKLFYYGKKENQ